MADSIGKRIWQAISPPSEEPAPRPEHRQRGMFSTDDVLTHEETGQHMQQFMEGLKEKAPAPDRHAMSEEGIGMDSDGDLRDFKEAYAWGQPNISEALAMWYANQGFIGHQLCAILSTHWLINKACTRPAEDAMRHWFDIVSEDGGKVDAKVLKMMRKADKDFQLKKKATQFIRKGNIFGFMVAIFQVESNDPDYYKVKFNPDAITPGSYKGIALVEPYWCTPLLDQDASAKPDSQHFYEPTWWIINGQQYHRSHLRIFIGDEVPDILKPSYLYGGVPRPQKILERVYAAERTANEAPHLAMSKRTTVLKVDVAKFFSNLAESMKKLLAWVKFRDNHAVKVIDKEEEDLTQFDTTLADFDALIMSQYQLVAAASDMPSTKLLETSPKGFNATGEYEESSYHETLESVQEHHGTPLVEMHHICVMRSIVVPALNVEPVETTVAWKPLDSPTAKEYAEIREINARTDVMLVEAQVLESEEVRKRVQSDPDAGYTFLEVNREPEEYGGEEGEAFSEEGYLATAV